MTLSAKEFYDKYKGKGTDIDGAYGVQCVDLFNAFNKVNNGGVYINCRPSGYAHSLYDNHKNNGVDKYYDVLPKSTKKQDGDWIIYRKGSIFKDSHVCMSYGGKMFGQNQTSDRKAGLKDYNKYDSEILGILRPKQYVKKASTTTTSSTSYYKKFTNTSIVAGLKSIKVDSSFAFRSKIAKKNGISNYQGTSAQNIKLLNLAKQGKLKKV